MKKLLIICFVIAALLIPAFVFAASCESEEGKDPTPEDIAKFGQVMELFSSAIGEGSPDCVETSDPESMPFTITFNDCDFEGIIVNGSVTLSVSGDENQFSITFAGTLTMTGTGAPANSVAFNFTLTVTGDYPDYTFAMTGTITIDGTVFKASGFMEDFADVFFYLYNY